MRAFALYIISLKSFWRKLQYDWAKELTVIVCSAVIMATFLYIFNDFLNHEVKQVSEAMYATLGRWSGWTFVVLATAYLTNTIASEHRKHRANLANYALFTGEHTSTVAAFKWLRALTIAVVMLSATWLLVCRFMFRPSWQIGFLWQVIFLVICAALVWLKSLLPPRVRQANHKWSKSLLRWRLLHLFGRNYQTQGLLLLGGLGCVALFVLAYLKAPLFLHILTAFVFGWITSAALNLQMAADLKYAWIEKMSGISHDQYLRCYTQLSLGLVLLLTSLYLPSVLANSALTVVEHTKVWVALVTPVYLMPALSMQIDPRRPLIQIITGFLVSLYLVTACYAHILSAVLLPILDYYARAQQLNRFYRS